MVLCCSFNPFQRQQIVCYLMGFQPDSFPCTHITLSLPTEILSGNLLGCCCVFFVSLYTIVHKYGSGRDALQDRNALSRFTVTSIAQLWPPASSVNKQKRKQLTGAGAPAAMFPAFGCWHHSVHPLSLKQTEPLEMWRKVRAPLPACKSPLTRALRNTRTQTHKIGRKSFERRSRVITYTKVEKCRI